jgi:hypothetical protein
VIISVGYQLVRSLLGCVMVLARREVSICGRSCAITKPATTSTGLTVSCTGRRHWNRCPNRSILGSTASEDTLASVA